MLSHILIWLQDGCKLSFLGGPYHFTLVWCTFSAQLRPSLRHTVITPNLVVAQNLWLPMLWKSFIQAEGEGGSKGCPCLGHATDSWTNFIQFHQTPVFGPALPTTIRLGTLARWATHKYVCSPHWTSSVRGWLKDIKAPTPALSKPRLFSLHLTRWSWSILFNSNNFSGGCQLDLSLSLPPSLALSKSSAKRLKARSY